MGHAAMIAFMSAASDIALMATMPLPEQSGGSVPEWVHLLPRGERIETWDGRGPFRYGDGPELIRASMTSGHARIVIDENHSTDLAAKVGMSAPARGYIVAMEEREDGIWGRVDWTEAGKVLMSDRAYWGLSPVFRRDKAGKVTAILRAALTNDPNLRGLAALNHQEDGDMPLLERLAELLGCDADDDAVVGAVTELHAQGGGKGDEALTELQSQVAAIGTALGIDEAADFADILAEVQAVANKGGGRDEVVTELQTQLASLTTELNTLRDSQTRERAEGFVDEAIRAGRVGVKPLRDHYIERHMKDPAAVEREIGAMPVLGGGGRIIERPAPDDGEISLNAQQRDVARMMGVSDEDYLAQLKAQQNTEEAG